MTYTVYCDGSARNNGYNNAVGAWAYVILNDHGEEIHHCAEVVPGATNQQMELMAAAEALEYLFYNEICVPFDKVEIYTDSAYLHNCYTQKWYVNWEKNGWLNAKKQPVANKELWEKLIRWFETPEVNFNKVKGHAEDYWNNFVDNLAQTASAKYKEKNI